MTEFPESNFNSMPGRAGPQNHAPQNRENPATSKPREPRSPENSSGAEVARTGEVEEPSRVMRIGSMLKQLLVEVREAPLDEAARSRLVDIYDRSLEELEGAISPDLVDELHRITFPLKGEEAPSDAELRVAQAQLVGWLEGLFHGIQAAMMAQQIQAQIHSQRSGEQPRVIEDPNKPPHDPGTGQYL